MKNPDGVRLIPTTAEHCAKFFPEPLPFRIRALTAIKGGEILGIGGLAALHDGTTAVFLEVSEETAHKYPITLYKAAKATLELAVARGLTRLRTPADQRREAAERFLVRLGFQPVGITEDNDKIWEWRAPIAAAPEV